MNSISILQGDITKVTDVDVIVNAANGTLLGGGGVDGAIHRAAGPKLLEFCSTLGGCETGKAKASKSYDLNSVGIKYILHTVGPVWKGGKNKEEELLASCYRYCFTLFDELEQTSIAFPSISTGAYGYPIELASKIAVAEAKEYCEHNDNKNIVFVCFEDEVFEQYSLFG